MGPELRINADKVSAPRPEMALYGQDIEVCLFLYVIEFVF